MRLKRLGGGIGRSFVAAIVPAMLAAVALMCVGPAAAVDRVWMQDAQLRAELTGVKLAGIYPGGLSWSEVVSNDGTTDYEEPNTRRAGRWTIAGELYCFIYAVPSQGGCFRVVKHSANCYELYTASIGGEPPAQPPPAAAMSWNGRMWRDAERTSCDEKITS